MKKFFITIFVITICSQFVLGFGCVSTMIAAGAYSSSKERDAYNDYVIESQKNNTEREEHGLQPLQIMSFRDWQTNSPTYASHPADSSTKTR